MEGGKHVAVEVPASKTVDECWQLIEVSERTRKHCMQLENCCYDFFELLTLNMARQGLFGDIVHGEGAYIHDLRWISPMTRTVMQICGGLRRMSGTVIFIRLTGSVRLPDHERKQGRPHGLPYFNVIK